MILHRGIPNGFLKENPHGIEQLNTIPDAIQEMMMQSFEGVIRIFPVWPREKHPKAAFCGFRACGAFEISASLEQGVVDRVCVISHKGHPCRLENPWPGELVEIRRWDDRREVLSGEILEIPMQKEEKIEIYLRGR